MSEKIISEWSQNLLQNSTFVNVPLTDNPEIITAAQAVKWTPGKNRKDMRPRVFDNITQSYTLLDSGSAVTVIPAGPDKKAAELTVFLKKGFVILS